MLGLHNKNNTLQVSVSNKRPDSLDVQSFSQYQQKKIQPTIVTTSSGDQGSHFSDITNGKTFLI